MAKEIWNNEIDMNTDWGGDSSTGNLPVSGEKIQELIKAQLNSKAGVFYYDSTNNRYLVFADSNARDTYLANPQDNSTLLLATFDAPFNYSAEINLISDTFVPILVGTSENYIEFTFDILNKSGQSIGEDVICTYTFVRGSVRKTVTQKYQAGTHVRFNIDKYIEVGTNNITVSIVGQNTLAATTIGVTYQLVDLVLTDSYDISTVNDLNKTTQLEIPYSISGYGTKIVEWYVDGVELPFIQSEDEITEVETYRVKYIDIDEYSNGSHSLQFRAYTVINGEKFYSKLLYRNFIVYTHKDNDPIVALAADLPSNSDILQDGDPLELSGIPQYSLCSVRVGLFNPTNAAITLVKVYSDNVNLITTLSMQNNKEIIYNLPTMSYGYKTITFNAQGYTRSIDLTVNKSTTSIEEITQSLSLALSATNKSNASTDKDVWTYDNFSTTFNDFKWNDLSGWNNGNLVISDGASIDINCAPLNIDAKNTGKTLEFEFSTKDVENLDAIVCDLRNPVNGAGILITASEASLISAGGSKVSTRYKSEENIRLSFVINKADNVVNKGLIFMYVNGILSGAANYSSLDNFITSKTITISSTSEVNILLKHLRFYDIALTSDQILSNYILYRDTTKDFMKIYNRNNIYEEGTTNFSTDILSGQLPVMIITGNIPALESTTDKNLQIDVDVEYINLQDQSRSFKLKNGAMRPQGTSSMSYPKKNFRLYTNKKDSSILYDADGKVVTDKKYSFKESAQPVDCWCFKADYAESSGTHNTGIARLWNDVLKNAQIDEQYKCRTNAQQAAIDANYPYDVRTTIDGFPILMFYRLTENDPLTFIGKYNFNNDKSTESVFGFKDIPGFDNTNMQCWEILNNGHHLALFTDTSDWNNVDGEGNIKWAEAFEARYPDGNTNTVALKAFADWMSTVTAENFTQEKYNHLDVYKVAAYYCYLMRFGAVDQTVKNAMFTTEDGQHWYFINYDNDTINGLRNDGLLIYPPTIDRQTLDSSYTDIQVYAYAGHDSRLWNMLEADTDFMSIVSKVDYALYSAGLTYNNVIKIFDDEQSDKWCERVYNQDSQYKYIGPFNDRGVNNLFMLQGSRQSHRRWWLSERFTLMDAKFASGEYKSNTFEVKLAGAPIDLQFSIIAGVNSYYGYGINNVPIQNGIQLNKNQSHTFTTTSVLNVGDPLRIYNAPYITSINISNFAEYLTQISIANVFSERFGSKLEHLILGKKNVTNTALKELSGINRAINLKQLSVEGFKGIKTLDLSNNTKLQFFYAENSGLTSLILPSSAPIEDLYLPTTLQSISLNELYELYDVNIQNNGCNLTTIEIKNCPNFNTYRFVQTWLNYKVTEDSLCSLTLTDIDWKNINADWLISLGTIGTLSLKGVIKLSSVTEEQIYSLQQLFGEHCFSSKSELYIKVSGSTPAFVVGPTTLKALSSEQYNFLSISEAEGNIQYTIEYSGNVSNSDKAKITISNNGLLTVGDIDNDVIIIISANFTANNGETILKRKTVTLQKINYPNENSILNCPGEIFNLGVYKCTLELSDYDDEAIFYTDWDIEGGAVDSEVVELGESDTDLDCTFIITDVFSSDFNVVVKCYRDSDNKLLFTKTKNVSIYNSDVILTKNSNQTIMNICYSKGWANNQNFMTKAEAAAVTNIGDAFNSTTIPQGTTFNEFVHFINAPVYTIISSRIKEVTYPWNNINVLKNFDNDIMHFPNATMIGVEDSNIETPIVFNGNADFPILYQINNNIVFNGTDDIYLDTVINLSGVVTFNNTEVVSFENLEIIDSGIIRCKKVKELSFPSLTTVLCKTYNDNEFPYIFNCLYDDTTSVLEKLYLPNLTELDGLLFYCPNEDSSFDTDNVIYYDNLIQLDISSLQQLMLCSCFISLNSLTTLNLNSLLYWLMGKIKSTSLTKISFPNIIEFGHSFFNQNDSLRYCTSLQELEGLEYVSAITGMNLFPDNFSLGTHITMPNLTTLQAMYDGYNYITNDIKVTTNLFKDDLVEFNAPNLTKFVDTFGGKQNLKTVNMPNVIDIYLIGTFVHCKKLEELYFPNANYNGITFKDTFFNCQSLKKITIGCSVLHSPINSNDTNIFYNCNVLNEINFPNATAIDFTISDCNVKTILLPKLETVSSALCKDLPKLTTINLDSVNKIGSANALFKIFDNCPLLETLYLPNCTYIGCDYYNHIFEGSNIKTLKLSKIKQCTTYNSILAASNVESIEFKAKENGTATIDGYLFNEALNLKTINIYNEKAPYINQNNILNVGTNVPEETAKTIHTLENATNYTTRPWCTKLIYNYGFTVVQDLEAPETES